MLAHRFTFTTTLERAESDVEIKVTARSENYAAAVGFPNEPCSRRLVTIECTEHEGEALSSDELEFLHEQAVDQLSYQ